jgi:redox-sensitive bicupin YhaK (pirin superfamily)
VQWMVAGRGVIHSEMPEQEQGRMEGFQLWLNLPGADKMTKPWYRDLPANAIPEVRGDGAAVKVIAGRALGQDGAMQRPHTEPVYLDLHLQPGASFAQPLPASHNAFVYVYRGSLAIAGTEVSRQRMAILADAGAAADGADGVVLTAGGEGAKAILVAGRPLREPIAQYGPFVMNTPQQLRQAIDDYQNGALA